VFFTVDQPGIGVKASAVKKDPHGKQIVSVRVEGFVFGGSTKRRCIGPAGLIGGLIQEFILVVAQTVPEDTYRTQVA
jgi:hypothetical protein